MSGEHHLAGPCEGISIHNDGCALIVRDTSGRGEDRLTLCASDDEARQAVWSVRDQLYAKYDPAAEALAALSLDTPSSDIKPEHSPELNRLMSRMFMEF